MAHAAFLLERASEADGDASGHALMASFPTSSSFESTADTMHSHDETCQGQLEFGGTLNKAELSVLMDLSKQLNLDGEITPVMAWGMVTAHPRFHELDAADFQRLGEELLRKVRCYGFGAVMENFEVRDAIEGVLSYHPEPMMVY